MQAETVLEKKLRLEIAAKKVLSLEKLFLALTLSMCIPDDLHLVNESLEQLEDLIEVYNKLSLG